MRYLLNSFSAQMLMPQLRLTGRAVVSFQIVGDAEARAWIADGPWESRVGHDSTAAMIAARLSIPVAVNRLGSTLQPGDSALIAQYVGPRLPEGAVSLPEGATIEWLICEVVQ